MKHVKFKPWIGSHYRQAQLGKRILILGESHYDWQRDQPIDDNPEITNVLIQEQIDGDCTIAYWTRIAGTFLDHKPTLDEKGSFWHSIAFYEYVQSSAGFGPRKRPSSEQWVAGEPAFFEVLESLQPELVVVLGYDLFENLPNTNAEGGPSLPEAAHVETCRYLYSGGSCLAIRLEHPSSGGFSGSNWRAPVMNAVKIA